MVKEGIVVLGHGSRRPDANLEIKAIVNMLTLKRPELNVVGAYVEFAQPSLHEAIDQLVKQGVKRVVIVPLFLTIGNHLHKHIPDKIIALEEKYPGLEIIKTRHLGADPLVIQIIENRIQGAEESLK